MIKRKILKKKRRNPEIDIIKFLEDLKPYENNIKVQSISEGGYGETYIFQINNRKVLNNGTILIPGEYLIKRFFNNSANEVINRKEIEYLIKLSNYGLIPKIYYIDRNFVIMKFIEALPLSVYIDNEMFSESEKDKIIERLYTLISKWHQLGFAHGDLSFTNILITKNYKVYLIDPMMINLRVYDSEIDQKTALSQLVNIHKKSDLRDLRQISKAILES